MKTRKITGRAVKLAEPVEEQPRPVAPKKTRAPKQRRVTRWEILEKLQAHPDTTLKVEVAPTKKIAQGACTWYRRGNGRFAIGVITSSYQEESDGTFSVFATFHSRNNKENS